MGIIPITFSIEAGGIPKPVYQKSDVEKFLKVTHSDLDINALGVKYTKEWVNNDSLIVVNDIENIEELYKESTAEEEFNNIEDTINKIK